jgi:hypothetical protein
MFDEFLNQYVIVRCHDAGVHAGILSKAEGRACVLKDARRLWYWVPGENGAFLSGVALYGLNPKSKVGEPVPNIVLTENCEIILCSSAAEKSIRAARVNVNGK